MINVLRKEGKLKKAKKFVGYMSNLGFKPSVVNYNTIIHGYCSRGNLEGASKVVKEMESKGIEPDSYMYSSIVN